MLNDFYNNYHEISLRVYTIKLSISNLEFFIKIDYIFFLFFYCTLHLYSKLVLVFSFHFTLLCDFTGFYTSPKYVFSLPAFAKDFPRTLGSRSRGIRVIQRPTLSIERVTSSPGMVTLRC